MNPPTTPERRGHPRRAAFIIAKYQVQEGTFRDIIRSIGATGVQISTWRRIAVGQSIDLQFPVFDFERQVKVSGRVVRSDGRGFSVHFDTPIADLICRAEDFPDIVHEIDR